MSGMFARIRWHLVGWNLLVVGLIMAVLGGALYVATSRNLLDQVDRDLASRGEQASENFALALGGDPGAGREGYQGGVFYMVVAADGRVLANPQGIDVASLERPPELTTPGTYATAELGDEPIRLLSVPLRDPPRRGAPDKPGGGPPGAPKPGGRVDPTKTGPPFDAKPGGPRDVGRGPGGRGPGIGPVSPQDLRGAVLLVGKSLAPEHGAIRVLLLVMVVGGALGMLLTLVAAWFLAGRSMVPIERAFQRQQEFVADASHELRTPLTVVRSSMDLLYQHLDEPLRNNVDLVNDVRDEVSRLQRLTGDLLTLARSDRGQLELELAPLNMRVIADDVARRLEPLAREGQVEVSVAAAEGVPAVEADPDRVRQLLVILIDNAIKHTPPGGRVAVMVRSEPRHVAVEIADTGPGIAPEHLPRLFERFYRADAARARAEGGTGLGLAIAKTLVDAHRGELAIASTPGQGTRVTVRLPTDQPDQPESGLGGRLGQMADRLTHGSAR